MKTYRKTLNEEQLEVLEILYRFRFGSNNLFANYFGKKDRSFVYKRLSILLERDLIGKRFEASYRLAGKPAAYYLTPAGAKWLQEARNMSFGTKYLYRAKTAKYDYIQRSLDVLKIYVSLKEQFTDGTKLFTKVDLSDERFDYFPSPLPDAYVRLQQTGDERQYFIELVYEKQPYFVINQIAQKYLDYDENGEWDSTGSALPIILVVCESEELKNRCINRLRKTDLEDSAIKLKLLSVEEFERLAL